MKLVVGLGNPGPEYADTRHNVGFRIVERLAARHRFALSPRRALLAHLGEGSLRGVRAALLEPQTWMNLSGRCVVAALEALAPGGDARSDLLVVYDDLDLPFGRLRLRPAGGAGGHRGLADIQDRLGHGDFPRLRFGIGRPPPGNDPVDYVLSPFDAAEREALDARLDAAADAIEAVLVDGVEKAMNRVNAEKAATP